jgi:hypothetical protein
MTIPVTTYQKQPGMLNSLLPTAGSVVGSYFGPVGSAVGGKAGGMVAGQNEKQKQQTSIETPQSSPMMRRQQAIQDDPVTQMRQGKIALASMDAETRKAYEPVIDEGLKRAAKQRQEQYGYNSAIA